MKRLAIASMLALGVVSVSVSALSAYASGIETVRIASNIDDTCRIWVNGTLRATIGPFGNSGVLRIVPSPAARVDLLATCDQAGAYQRVVVEPYSHCDFTIEPADEFEHRFTRDSCT